MRMSCVACRQGFPWECLQNGKCADGNNNGSANVDSPVDASNPSDTSDPNALDLLADETEESDDYVVRGQDDSKLKDQQSTGRKRAAKMYPIADGAPCEWKNKKNCGGGKHPIVGCATGTQQARHHGPDKNTLNNEKGNVHRICHTCHNRWHTENDEGYVWGDIYNPHNPVAATLDELKTNELSWLTRDVKQCKD